MWTFIKIKSLDYLINFEFGIDQSSLKVLISNFEDIWSAEFSEKQLHDTFKKLNPIIEWDKTKLINEIQNVFTKKKNEVSWNIEIFDTALKLNLQSIIACVLFKFEINFHKINNKVLFETIVFPLLILVKGMHKQNEYLCDIIKKKDTEILEYKMDGAVLSRKAIETPTFDEITLNCNLDKNLQTISSENLNCLLDETLAQLLDKIKRFTCHEPVPTVETRIEDVSIANGSSDCLMNEPPQENLVENVCTTKSKTGSYNSTLGVPIIKKKRQVTKRLHNL